MKSRHKIDWLMTLVIAVGATALYAATAAPTITARFGGTDGGELAATALSGGTAHPTGYPAFLLLARLALAVARGEAAQRIVWVSVIGGAVAAACVGRIVARSNHAAPAAWIGGLYAGLGLATAPALWSQAIIVEVYALHAALLAMALLLAMLWFERRTPWLLVLLGVVIGVAAANHLTSLALLPAFAVAAYRARPGVTAREAALCCVTAAIVAIGLYSLLVWWSARAVFPNWGDQRALGGWWAHISGTEYRYLAGIVPLNQQIGRLAFALHDLINQPGIVGVALAAGWGIGAGWRTQRAILLATIVVATMNVVFALGYGGADGTVYLLPWTLCWYVWAGWGAAEVLTRLDGIVRLAAIGGLVLALVWPLVHSYPRLDLHADTNERTRIVQSLDSLPTGAVVVTHDDRETFGAWYAQRALGARTDVIILDQRLLAQAWYRQRLQQTSTIIFSELCQSLPATIYDWSATTLIPITDRTMQRNLLGCP